MSEKNATEERKAAEKQKVPGQEGRDPTEGKWIAEPRSPDPEADGDAIARLSTEKRDDSVNPQSRQKGPDKDDIEEKVVEAGVEDTKLKMETEWEIGDHKVPGT